MGNKGAELLGMCLVYFMYTVPLMGAGWRDMVRAELLGSEQLSFRFLMSPFFCLRIHNFVRRHMASVQQKEIRGMIWFVRF